MLTLFFWNLVVFGDAMRLNVSGDPDLVLPDLELILSDTVLSLSLLKLLND